MYINFDLFSKKELTAEKLLVLLAIKQKEQQYINEAFIDEFIEKGWCKFIKGNKSATRLDLVRISDSGNKLLNELEESPVEPEDEKVYEWLKNYYVQAGKDLGNGAKTRRHIRDFRIKSGISKNNLIKLVLDFLKENEERSRKLEYIWYYPKTAFATKFDLEESWLWVHFTKNKERLIKTFEEY